MTSPLGTLTPQQFLTRHWHKAPLLTRAAIPGFLGFLTPAEIKKLATRADVQSRLIMRHGQRFELHHGPFRPIDFKSLPDRDWTVLVQELNHWIPEGADLLNQFNFAPHTRLDDLMVSYAVPGGGVGPHFDSYDVFLLQGFGERRWSIAKTRDLELIPDSDLKILKHFKPQSTWNLDAGDMLYLPPQYAHDGVALSECFTYSIGFRAPTHQEWVDNFLDYLRDSLTVKGRYADPDLALQSHPAELSADLLKQVGGILQSVCWNDADILSCIGRNLSEPKNHIFFERPDKPLTKARFISQARQRGLRLNPRSRLLFRGNSLFVNGEEISFKGRARAILIQLADNNQLSAGCDLSAAADLLYAWYLEGWLD
jgi:50S ribosomal protein L16 3-hydroxylase